MLADAEEIKARATRRLGQLMAQQKATVGVNPGVKVGIGPRQVIEKPTDTPTLADAGIDKNLAHRARQAAAISDAEFERVVAEQREKITTEADRIERRIYNAIDVSATKASRPVGPPSTGYNCIVVDPPWLMQKIERASRGLRWRYRSSDRHPIRH
jgi:hypothetical protein